MARAGLSYYAIAVANVPQRVNRDPIDSVIYPAATHEDLAACREKCYPQTIAGAHRQAHHAQDTARGWRVSRGPSRPIVVCNEASFKVDERIRDLGECRPPRFCGTPGEKRRPPCTRRVRDLQIDPDATIAVRPRIT